MSNVTDVIVVGASNAAFCAALAAHGAGRHSRDVREAAPEDKIRRQQPVHCEFDVIRVVYNGIDDIKTLVPDLTPAEVETTDFGTYTADQFFDDMARITQNRADPDLVKASRLQSFDSLNWMRRKGIRLIPIYGQQAFKIDGKFQVLGRLDGQVGWRRPRPYQHAHRVR